THIVDHCRQPDLTWQNLEPQNQQIPANWWKKSSRQTTYTILHTQIIYLVPFSFTLFGCLLLLFFFSMKIFGVKRSSKSISMPYELFVQMGRKRKNKRLISFTDFDIKIRTFMHGLLSHC
ncbi:hypothetical protein ACH5RR_022403, partial [Cinchona calisaya]